MAFILSTQRSHHECIHTIMDANVGVSRAGGRDKKGNGDSFHSPQKRGQQRAMPSTYGAEVIVNTEDEWKPWSTSTI
jgi:hypothetical protein